MRLFNALAVAILAVCSCSNTRGQEMFIPTEPAQISFFVPNVEDKDCGRLEVNTPISALAINCGGGASRRASVPVVQAAASVMASGCVCPGCGGATTSSGSTTMVPVQVQTGLFGLRTKTVWMQVPASSAAPGVNYGPRSYSPGSFAPTVVLNNSGCPRGVCPASQVEQPGTVYYYQQ